MPKTKKNSTEGGFSDALRQILIIALISAAVVAAAHPLFILIGNNTDLFDYDPLRFILGSVYGWLLGVGNFAAMAVTLILLTSSSADRREGQKRAQAAYMGRLVAILLFAVGGCFIPVFHPAAILVSLALTQFGIFVYSLTFKLIEARKREKAEQSAPRDDTTEAADDSDAPSPEEEKDPQDPETASRGEQSPGKT